MAEGGCSSAGLCTAEEEAENVENQANEVGMIQSIFEGQMVLLNSTEYIVRLSEHYQYRPMAGQSNLSDSCRWVNSWSLCASSL